MSSADWRRLLLDGAQLDRWDEHLQPCDPLEFEDGKRYVDRISRAQAMTGATEAIEIGPRPLGRDPNRLRRHIQLRLHGRQHGFSGR